MQNDEMRYIKLSMWRLSSYVRGENNEPVGICDGFSKMGGEMSLDSKLTTKYGAGKTKTTEFTKDKGESLFDFEKTKCKNEYLRR